MDDLDEISLDGVEDFKVENISKLKHEKGSNFDDHVEAVLNFHD